MTGLSSVVKAEHVNISNLDRHNISIIATVMAQTVALDYYQESVDRMLEVRRTIPTAHTHTSNSVMDMLCDTSTDTTFLCML